MNGLPSKALFDRSHIADGVPPPPSNLACSPHVRPTLRLSFTLAPDALGCAGPVSMQPKERRTQNRQRSLASRPRQKAHTRGHPCRECWRAGRTKPLARHAPGACHQQGVSRHHSTGGIRCKPGLFCDGEKQRLAWSIDAGNTCPSGPVLSGVFAISWR